VLHKNSLVKSKSTYVMIFAKEAYLSANCFPMKATMDDVLPLVGHGIGVGPIAEPFRRFGC
jgi:hypothetical protein